MSNFCRITGRTRGVPTRSHYAPLLPPISKADARRLATCHVTRGALAMPYPHHFIPVILVQRKRRATLAHAGLRRDVPPHQSSLKSGLVQQAPAEVWPPPDWDKRRAAREAALQKLDEARDGRAVAAAAKESRRREERHVDWDEDAMLGRKIPEEGSEDTAAIPMHPEEDSRKKSGGLPKEEDISMPQAATAEEIGQAAPPPEDEPVHITHKVLSEYRYVIPVLEGDEAKPLRKIIDSEGEKAKAMEAAEGGPNSRYVYIVDQYQCGIVLPSQLECAIRGGALEEVMVSPNLEKVALRLKRPGVKPGSTLTGENVVTVEAKLLLSEELENMVLLEGEGPDDLKWSGLEEDITMTDVGGIVMQETVIGSESGESVALVPGQVVETSVGPRFVPGQIVVKEGSEEEKGVEGEKVQFVPGEIVETSEGPRFVAPDLTETEDGKMAFSVQGFAVEDVSREKNIEEGGQPPPTQIPRRLSVQLEGIVQEVVSGGDGKKEPTGATIVKAIVSEKDIMSTESVPEPMDIDVAQESSKKRRNDSEEEEEVGEGQAMIRHLSKKLQTKDSREANESAAENAQTPQVRVGEDITKEEIELRVDEMRRLATEAASIGASLGLPPADAAALLEALSDPETAKALASDPVSVRLLRGGVKALRKQRRREMRRASRTTSGLLSLTEETGEDEDDDDDMDDESEMDIPDMIRSSRDIPSFLFKKLQDPSLDENDQEELANKILAGLRSNSDSPIPRPGSPESIAIVILKDNLQAVIPREASRRLLTGNAPFTIIDETGVRRFKPSPLGEGSIDKNALSGDSIQKLQSETTIQKPQSETTIPQGVAEAQPVSAASGGTQGKTQSDLGVTQPTPQGNGVSQVAASTPAEGGQLVVAGSPTQVASVDGPQLTGSGVRTETPGISEGDAKVELKGAAQEKESATKGSMQIQGAGVAQMPVSSAQLSGMTETGGTQTGGTTTTHKEGLAKGEGAEVAGPEDKRVPSEAASTTGSPGEVGAQVIGAGSTHVAGDATKTTISPGGAGAEGAKAGDAQVAGVATKTTASPGALGTQVAGTDAGSTHVAGDATKKPVSPGGAGAEGTRAGDAQMDGESTKTTASPGAFGRQDAETDAGKVIKSDQVSIGGTGSGHADGKEGAQMGITGTMQVTSSTNQATGSPGAGGGDKFIETGSGKVAGLEGSGGEKVGGKEGGKLAESSRQVTDSLGAGGMHISKAESEQSSPTQVMVSSTGVSQVEGSRTVAQETVSAGKDGSTNIEMKSKIAEKGAVGGSESSVKEIAIKKRSSSLSSKEFAVTSIDSELESAALKARWVARAAYTPGGDDQEGLALAEGDAVELVAEDETESAAKRARLQSTEVTESFFSSTTVVEGSSAVTSTSASSSTRLLDNSAARHKISVRPRRKHADPRQRGAGVVTSTSVTSAEDSDDRVLVRKVDEPSKKGWVPASILTAQDGTGLESGLSLSVVVAASQQEDFMEVDSEGNETAEEASFKRDAVIRELVETEEEFGKDLKFVVDRYLKPLEDHHGGGPITPSSSSASVASSGSSPTASIPRLVRDHKDVIFGNFSLISEFHNGVLIEGFKYYANEPKMIGRTFLRLERDFDKHVAYCRDEPQAQAFLEENEAVREYFEEYSQQIGDDKSLAEHLKLPIQRINDYQLLLKELVKYSNRLGEDATDLQRALELMLGVPHRSGDLKFISSIEGYRGNIHKLGRLLRHDWFSIEEGEAGCKTKERYLFLFKGKILVCKVRRIQDDRSVFALKEILRLPELELKDIPEDTKAFHLRRNPKVEAIRGEFEANFPLLVKAHSDEAKADWLAEIRQHAVEVFDVKEVPNKDPSSDIKKIYEPEVQKKEDIKSPSPPTQKQAEIPAAVPTQAPAESKAVPAPEKKPETPTEPKKTESPVEVKPSPKQPEVSPPPPKQPEVSVPTPKQPEVSPPPPKQPEVSPPPPKQPESTAATPTAQKEQEGPTISSSIPKQPESPAEVPVKPKEVETPLEASPAPKQPEGPTTIPSAPKEADSTAKVLAETKKVETPIEAPPAPKQSETPAVPEPTTDKPQIESVKIQDISSEAPSGTKCKEVELEDKDTAIKTEDHPTKKLETTETTTSTNGNEEPGEMDQSYSMTRKSSRTSKTIEVSSSYAESSQAEMYMETSSSTSARRSSSLRTSSVRFESDGIAENGALAIEAMSSTTNVARGSIGSDNKPIFTRTIEGFSCEPGEKAEFECHIRSDSITSLTWLKDNRPLDDRLADRISIKQQQDRHCLEIQHCRETDSGMYTALASNDNGVNSCSAHLVVQELTPEERKRRDEDKAPIFIVRLKDTELLENTYLRFFVKVKGDPNPIVRFYKNGKEIKEESPEERVHVVREQGQKKGYYELVIADVRHADAGKYSCVAVNEYGDATCEGQVTVSDEKTIFAGLGDETDSSSKPSFTWLRDGKPFDPEERFKVLFKDDEDSLALVFQHVKPEDAGLYTCVASTSSGKISCSAELTVKGAVNQLMKEPEKPKITTENQSNEVNVGGSAMLELKASGYPKPDVKWYKESGEEITAGGKYRFLYEDEESIALVMKGVTVDDGGKYKIVAKNDLGEDTAEIQLSVKSPPKILTKTTDMVCKIQETFEMTIEVEGSPAPDVKWYKDGQEVSASATVKIGSKKDKTSNSMSHSLTLTSTKLEDAGSYSVVATNELSQSSAFWKFTVTSPPRFVRSPAPETIIGEGEAVTIEARVEGFPAPTVKWLKDDNEIKADGKKIKINSEGIIHTISLTGSGRYDSGVYTCVATNEYGTEKASGTLHVRCPPQFKQGLPKEAQANEGDVDVEFVVQVEAYPKPSIKWYLDEVEITEKKTEYTRIEEGDNYKLVIREVTTETSGKYSCKIFNDLGSNESSCSFSVLCKPRFPKGLSDKAVDEGDSLTLTIECYANPEPEVKWFKDGEEIKVDTRIHIKRDGSETYNLTLDIVKKSDTGEYEVHAKNKMGEVITRSKLHVHSSTQTDDTEDEKKESEDAQSKSKKIIEEEEIEIEEEENVVRMKRKPEEENEEKKLEKGQEEVVKIGAQTVEESQIPLSQGSSNLLTPHTLEKEQFDSPAQKVVDEELEKGSTGKVHIIEVVQEGVIIEEPLSPACVSHLQSPMAKNAASMSGVSIVSLSESEDDAQQTPTTAGEDSADKSYFDICDGPSKLQGKILEASIAEEEECVRKLSVTVDEEKSKPIKANVLEKDQTVEVIVKAGSIEEQDVSPTAMKALSKDKASHKVLDEEMDVKTSKIEEQEASPASKKALMKDKAINEILDDTNIVSSTDSAKSQQALAKEKGELVDSNLSHARKMSNDENKPQIGMQLTKGESSKMEGDNVEEDEAVEALLRRVQKQRSVLGEILEKENGRTQEVAPEILSSNMTDSSLYESLSKVFEVKATGSPRPEAKWYKDGKELKSSDKINISDSGEVYKLEIKDSLMSDEGVYKCVVSNRLGEKSVECKLSLICVNEFRKPKITCELKDVKVKKGEEAVLRATIIADPVPEITWYHENRKLNAEGDKVVAEMEEGPKEINDGLKECTFTLKVPNGEHFDSGIYRIQAKNKYGEGDCSARLDILLKPEIDGIKDVTTIPHETIIFKVIIYSNPVAKVVWSKDGEKVIATEKIKITEDLEKEEYQIQLFDVGLAEDGVYTVTATNDQGESSSTATLKVHTEPPSFVKNLEDQTVKAYHDAEYRIRVNGIPKPQIRWYKDGVELKTGGRLLIEIDEEHQTSSLTLQHMEEDDEGKYTVRASNIVGDAETHSKLKMAQTPPSFAHPLDRSAEVDEGDLLELKVKVDGSPIPTVKWYKDGEEIVPNEHIQLVALPDGNIKLTIESVKPTDCGAYKLVVANKNGEKSSICAVAVKPNPRRPSFTKGLEDTKLVVGQPLKLEVQVMAFPAPEIKWFKDGHPIRPSQAVNFVNSPGGIIGLHIDSVRPEDAGHYTITVANRLGEISGEADVQVEARDKKPQFQAFLQPVSVVEGYPAKMEIKVLGHPKPALKWTHNGKEIVPDGQRICIKELPDGTVALLIDKATAADAGEYAVIASNEKGDVTSKAVLDVAGKDRDAPEEPPSFVHALRDVSVDEGSLLVLEAPFLGNPIPEVKWTKDGQPLVAGERNMMTCDGRRVGLEVKPANLDDAGEYECTLTNPLGSATSSSRANVRKIYQKPSFTQGFGNIQQLPGFDAKFPVKVAGFPTPELTWYKNGEPINAAKHPDKYRIRRDGDTCCLFVRDCAPEDAGRYRCRASNLDGEASCEANLEVVEKIEKGPRAEAPSFLKRIGDCEVYQGMTAKFTACATGYPEPEFEWYRNGDRLWPSDRIKTEKEGSGLLRLSIFNVCPSDVSQYSLRIYNPHGEDKCEAQLTYDSLESRPKRPIGDQYVDYDKFRHTGLPLPLADRPIISRMTDRRLTLSWKPYINISPTDLRNPPVTYRLEMCEMPDGDWFTVRSGIRSCACDVSNLEPFRDYKFRVRVENKYGISDPSPFAITYREKLEPEPPKFFPYLEPGIDFRPETSPYFPKDFDIEKPPHDAYSQAPRFLRQEHDTQYGVKGHNSNLFWFVYGYPKPKMTYYFNDELIEMGGRYDASYTRNGQATLFINRMLDRDVGWYEAVARNEHGEARQRVRLEIAEFPKFITRPEEIVIMLRRSGRLEAKVTGVPYPEIKWYKDWQPLAPSSRIKMMFHPPDTCILSINDVINRDEGLYSISARNVAGSVSASAMIHVEEDERQYAIRTYGRYGIGRPEIKARPGDGPKGFSELYNIGDELGRGTQGITYHAVERSTGHNYAAKIMHGKGDLRPFMYNELEILNLLNHRKILRLHEAYETNRNLTLILELASGGEFFDILSKHTYYTESDIAGYVRQILWGLEHLHENSIAHLGLTPGDILFSHPGGDEVKICDFGLARRIALGKLASLSYGVPEFVAPEVANGDGVGFPADMWSLGIIIHILLSGGISLFRGRNDKETLEKIKSLYENPGSYLSSLPDYLSPEARDFITQLLVVHTEKRMDVTAALRHPWLVRADRIVQDEYQIGTSGLRTYLSGLRDWYSNASCRKWFRRRPLDGAYTHPSKMVYPPGMSETPPDTPRVSVDRTPKEVRTWESMLPPREPVDYEIGMAKSESHYQYGPDTYLLQLRDVSFPVRLREYMKVAANRSPGYSHTIADTYDWRTPIIRERRRFTDVMDEEIDDERKTRIDRYGSREGLDGAVDGLPVNGVPQTSTITPRRLRRELGTRLDAHAEAEAYMECKREGQIPFFREKPQILPIREDHPAELVCLAVGDPKPLVQWFKNDMVITENNRIKISDDADGRSILRMDPALSYDVGIYKVVARNKIGQTVARTRLILASAPGSPDSPDATDVSDTEILLKWKQPHEDGNSPILCYSLQYKEADKVDWIDLGSNIDHEFYLVGGLRPATSYHFRLAACNRIGWSAKGIPTDLVKTKAEGAPKVQMSRAMRHLQELTDSGAKVAMDDAKPHMDYSTEKTPPEWNDGCASDKFKFISEISRGRFSSVVKALEKSSDRVVAAKIFEWHQAPSAGSVDGAMTNGVSKESGAQISESGEAAVQREFEALRSLRHERVAFLESAWHGGGIAAFIMEKLQGADVLTFLSSRHEFSEEMVAIIITQVLDGLQYLHWRGYCHLNIQPDNIVMASVRSVNVKLVDFGSAQRVTRLGSPVYQVGHPEYAAPELQSDDPVAYPQTDIWSVGVIAYVLLSGESPFRGATLEETRQNVNFVRFRFEYLFKELTQEATRFIMLVFKKAPGKRPLPEECHEHRWLLPTEFMIKKRERAVFLGNRLKEFSDRYHSERDALASKLSESLSSALGGGGRGSLLRSTSIQEELTATT